MNIICTFNFDIMAVYLTENILLERIPVPQVKSQYQSWLYACLQTRFFVNFEGTANFFFKTST